MESSTMPKLRLPESEMLCQKPNHAGKKIEFVCTKADCTNRLACPQCLLTDHSDHFQWMIVIEDFFLSTKQQSSDLESDDKVSMIEFVKDKQALTSKFEAKIQEEQKRVLTELENFKTKMNEKFNALENIIMTHSTKYTKEFSDNVDTIQSLVSEDKELKVPDSIEDTKTLVEYLNTQISKENDVQEKKYERIFETIKDHLNALSLMQFHSEKNQDIIDSLDDLLTFNVKIDTYRFFKKNTTIPLSKLDCQKLILKRTVNTQHKKAIYKVIFLQDENKIATCSDDHTIIISDLKSGETLSTLQGHSDRIWTILKLRNGNIASCSSDQTVRIWNTQKGNCEKVLHGHTGLVCALVELPNLLLMSGSQDKCIKIWDLKLETKNLVRTIKNNSMGRIMSIVLLDSDTLLIGSENTIQTIKYEDGTCKSSMSGHTALVRDLYVVEDKQHVISASDDKSVRLWSLTEQKCLKTFTGHSHSTNKVLLFNPNIIVSASDDHSIRFWNIADGNCVKVLTGHEGWVIHITILIDGTLLSCGADKTIRLWGNQCMYQISQLQTVSVTTLNKF